MTVLAVSIVLLVVITILSRIQTLASSLLNAYSGEKLLQDFRAQLFRHVQRLSVSYHDSQGTADTLYRIQNDTNSIQYVCIEGAIPFVTACLTLITLLYVTARIDWQLALVAMAIAPVLYQLSQTYRPRLRERSREVRKLESSALAVVQEVLSALRVVKAFGREEHEGNRYVHRSMEGMRARMRLAWNQNLYEISVGLTTAVGTSSALWIGVRHVLYGQLTLGGLLLVMAYLGQLYDPLRTIGRRAATLQGHLASAERAFSLLDRMPDVKERPNAHHLVQADGAITFENVSFAYDGAHTVLHEISFVARPGTRVGIAGHTGAGKTTLISLLNRFYDPTAGRILLDGVDLREYKLADLRNQFAMVLQDTVLFSSSIAENIAYARPTATQEEIVKAAQMADAHNFVVALPGGYQTLVGERGMRLSGGERQRISLARAFLRNAPILVLDEPTSAVDVKTEARIMEALERLMKGRTTFIIAHRLSTLRGCDLRMELEHGKMVSFEQGSLAGSAADFSSGVGAATIGRSEIDA